MSEDGYSALKLATIKDWTKALKVILNKQPMLKDTLYGDEHEESILHVAAGRADWTTLLILLQNYRCHEVIDDYRGTVMETPLWQAVHRGSAKSVQVLLNKGADYKTPYLMHKVVSKNLTDTLRSLIIMDRKWFYSQCVVSSQQHRGMNCFHIAASLHDSDCIKLLFDSYINTEEAVGKVKYEDRRLKYTVLQEQYPILETVDDVGETPLLCAASARSKQCVKFLLEKRCNIAVKTTGNRSALQIILKSIPRGVEFMDDIFSDYLIVTDFQDLVAVDLFEEVFEREKEKDISSMESHHWIVLNFGLFCLEGKDNQLSIIQSLLLGIQHPRERQLFCHPLVQTFVFLKWQKVKWIFLLHFVTFVMYVISITFVILVDVSGNDNLFNACNGILIFSCISVLLVEIPVMVLEYATRGWRTFRPIARAFPPVMGFITAAGDIKNDLTIKAISAFAVVLAWLSVIEQTAGFAAFGKYAFIYQLVMARLIKVCALYVCIVVGFSIGFYTLMTDVGGLYDSFPQTFSLYLAVWSTTRKYDKSIHTPRYDTLRPGDKNYVERDKTRIVGMTDCLFTLYIFIGVVCLMNFIIGENVLNFSEVEAEVDFWQLQDYVQFMWNIETMLLGMKSKYARKLLKKLHVKAIVILNVGSIEKIFPYDLATVLLDITSSSKARHKRG